MTANLRVLEPGMLTTVQDLGRSGFTSLGVAIGGAADKLSLRIGNRLVGNADNIAALEFTLTGGRFAFEKDSLIAVTGGVGEVSATDAGELRMWQAVRIRAGEQLRIGPVRRGCRIYLSVQGGIRVQAVLGSASTHLAAGFGGYEGRTLKTDDVLQYEESAANTSPLDARTLGTDLLHRRTLRAIEAPIEGRFHRDAADAFWNSEFSVSNQSDRAGIRLEGHVIASLCAGRMTSEGMTHGVIEVPENGQPIILGVDHPTTGGYPSIACIASVDLPVLGQLRPRETVRFERLSVDEARKLFASSEAELSRVLPPHFP
ncbi:MAG: biotin-dependent carboxyltransferase family protein [Phycisphaerales bacterium]